MSHDLVFLISSVLWTYLIGCVLDKGVETVDFFPVHPQPRRQHNHHVQPGGHPQLPCLCRKGGNFQVVDFSHFLALLHFLFLSFDQTNFLADPSPSGIEFKGPLWQPTRAFANLTSWSMFILVPIFYRAIFKFRRVHALTAGKTWMKRTGKWRNMLGFAFKYNNPTRGWVCQLRFYIFTLLVFLGPQRVFQDRP